MHWLRQEEDMLSMGVVYRVSYVRFDHYTNAGLVTGFGHLWRHEPMLFARFGTSKKAANGPLHYQLALGYSFSPGFTMSRERAGNRDATEVRKPLPSFMFSMMLRPDILWKQLRRQ